MRKLARGCGDLDRLVDTASMVDDLSAWLLI